MPFQPADTPSLALFLLTVCAVLALVLWGAWVGLRPVFARVALFLTVWVVGTSLVVGAGVLRAHFFPAVPLFMATVVACGLGFGLGPWGRGLALGLPVWAIAAFQGFRLPLEIVLHLWAGQGTVPETMTWSGSNLDVITGILALGALLPFLRGRFYLWLVDGLGMLLLLNLFRVVVMSSPFPFAWKVEPPLVLGAYLPYALIATVCVWAAVAGHVVLTRALLAERAGGR